MTDALRKAAQAVLDRWDSPQWEWRQHGPTADLMADLRAALAQPVQQPGAEPVARVDWQWRDGRKNEHRVEWLIQPATLEDGAMLYTQAAPAQRRQHAEIERLRADAARYQFLRDDFSPMGLNIDGNHAWAYRRNATLKGPNLDSAIDAAMRDAP